MGGADPQDLKKGLSRLVPFFTDKCSPALFIEGVYITGLGEKAPRKEKQYAYK
jgi:hypothetical protein